VPAHEEGRILVVELAHDVAHLRPTNLRHQPFHVLPPRDQVVDPSAVRKRYARVVTLEFLNLAPTELRGVAGRRGEYLERERVQGADRLLRCSMQGVAKLARHSHCHHGWSRISPHARHPMHSV
jgi:hypothetical protein